MMTVYDLKVGQKATIYDIAGDIRLAKRLFALGCINGTEICVKKIAPFVSVWTSQIIRIKVVLPAPFAPSRP